MIIETIKKGQTVKLEIKQKTTESSRILIELGL